MAVITPQTNIRIIKLPLELDSKNQLTFSNISEQETYFKSLVHLELANATYMRSDGTLRFNCDYDTAIQYNYCMYQNTAYSNKWFYAFITDVEWLSNNSVAIKIKTDVFQTWQFNIEYKQSFIEREHVNDDTIGKHTVPENLETGDYITNETPIKLFTYDTQGTNESYIIIGVTDFIKSIDEGYTTPSKIINGVYGGLYYIVCIDEEHANEILASYSSASKLDYIQCLFMIPKALITYDIPNRLGVFKFAGSTTIYSYIKASNDMYKIHDDVTININTSINGYTPKNKKLFTSKYNHILLTNNGGGDISLNYEDFINNTPKFGIYGVVTPGCSIRCIPLNYKLINDNNSFNSYNFGINGIKYPICSWTGDTYTNWLTQNGANILTTRGMNMVMGGIGVGLMMSGNPLGVGMVTSAFASTTSSLLEQYQHSKVPEETSGNINSGDITFSSGNSVFTVYKQCIKKEYAQIIDKFFTMYGYKVNITKLPNITGRRNWNFVKTIGCNIHLYAPQSDVDELKTMFDNGLTLWHSSSTYLDYSQNNDII